MEEHIVTGITLILTLGIGAQWLAWRLRLPSILLLLVIGFAAGPVWAAFSHGHALIDPDGMMGSLLFPIVSISVALILFEGGLSLKFSELMKVGGTVISLVTVGALVAWASAAAAARYLLGFAPDLAMLAGAILVVTGPTVIGPLLRDVRPKKGIAMILKWEGIVIDPVGAILTVLVFETIALGETKAAFNYIAAGTARYLAVGTAIGMGGAGLMYLVLRRRMLPDFLQSPVMLMAVVAIFTGSNLLIPESGLLSVTVMGTALANFKKIDVHHIIEFKENLRVLLISGLFILLASRIEFRQFKGVGPSIVAFVLALVFVARPASVFAATLFSKLSLNEKLFLSWMAPRGIVAAAVSSIFAIRLQELGRDDAAALVAVVFSVIVATVMIYSLTAGPVARRLSLAQRDPQGVLFLGATPFALALAGKIQEMGFKLVVVDSNWHNVNAARMAGIPAFHGNALSHRAQEEIDFDGIGRLFAMTGNDDVNSLSALHFSEMFGKGEVYQLPYGTNVKGSKEGPPPLHLRGRFLFSGEITFNWLAQKSSGNWIVKSAKITGEFGFDDLKKRYNDSILPLLKIDHEDKISVFTVDARPAPKDGDRLVFFVNP